MAKQRAEREAQQNKADQERVQRSVAGVNHLEIPAELAFILSKLGSEYEAVQCVPKYLMDTPAWNIEFHDSIWFL